MQSSVPIACYSFLSLTFFDRLVNSTLKYFRFLSHPLCMCPLNFRSTSQIDTDYSVDDAFLQRAVSCIPKRSIFLLEDIDCAFPPREGDEESDRAPTAMDPYGAFQPYPVPLYSDGGQTRRGRSQVTLSGLLNVLDGVGSEEGKIFFATVSTWFKFTLHRGLCACRPTLWIIWTMH